MIEVAGVTEELKACGPYALRRADEYTESTSGGNYTIRVVR